MGQTISFVWRCVCPKARFETPRDDNHDHHINHKGKQLESHTINIHNDDHVQPALGFRNGIIEHHGKQFEIEKVVVEKNVTTTISHVSISVRKLQAYNSAQKILLVGEGDFSFSACLARAFGSSAHNITATSLNSQDFLMKNYRKFLTNKAQLETRGCMLLHDVDATKMMKHPLLGNLRYDRIIFNFPHTGNFGRTYSDICEQKKLVRGFLRNAKKMIKEDGEIHITSKSNVFFLQWNIPKIGSDQGLNLIKEVKFTRTIYPGYHTKYGFGGDRNFYCNPSTTYVFCLCLNES